MAQRLRAAGAAAGAAVGAFVGKVPVIIKEAFKEAFSFDEILSPFNVSKNDLNFNAKKIKEVFVDNGYKFIYIPQYSKLYKIADTPKFHLNNIANGIPAKSLHIFSYPEYNKEAFTALCEILNKEQVIGSYYFIIKSKVIIANNKLLFMPNEFLKWTCANGTAFELDYSDSAINVLSNDISIRDLEAPELKSILMKCLDNMEQLRAPGGGNQLFLGKLTELKQLL